MTPSALPLPLGTAPPAQRPAPATPPPALQRGGTGPAAAEPARPAAPGALRAAALSSELSPAERRGLIAGVGGLHLLLLWGLLQVGAVRQVLHPIAPLMVDFISVEAPPKPAPPPPPPQPERVRPLRPAPLPVVVAAPTPQAPPAPTSFVVPEPLPQPVQAAPAPPAPVTAPAPVQAPVPKPVAASALRYAVLPPVELPLASRRLGESGTVLLRVVFDAQGHVKQASVQRSSGFARLDEQALAAMRQARIQPFLENGQAIEVSALAPLAYELD
ncbi:MAG: energy transducer TonB [Burkholderiaceae bacterium]|nr:energy transducer TonB [Burkholderiaceae bacterium]